MKKLIYTLAIAAALLFSSCAQSQEKGIYIDKQLIPYIDQFVDEARSRGVDVIPQLMAIDSIQFREPMAVAGKTNLLTNSIHLHGQLRTDTLAVKAVLFHELGHLALGILEHSENCEEDIMCDTAPENFEIFADTTYWQKCLDKLFGNGKIR